MNTLVELYRNWFVNIVTTAPDWWWTVSLAVSATGVAVLLVFAGWLLASKAKSKSK